MNIMAEYSGTAENDTVLLKQTEMKNSSKERILGLLRSSGYRVTKQRELLIDILLEGSCASGKEIYLSAKERESDIGFATVYRFLGTLEELGVISRSNMFRVINT